MAVLIDLINGHVPVHPLGMRVRAWLLVGTAYRFHGGIRIDIEREREGDSTRLRVRYSLDGRSESLAADVPVSLGTVAGVVLVPRAIAHSATGKPLAVLMEIQRGDRIDRIGVGFEVAA